jgi:hypothetical protein
VTGNFIKGSDVADIAVLQNFAQGNGTSQLAILIGRGDGTFQPAVTYPTAFAKSAGPMVVGDFTGNGIDDIIVFSQNEAKAEIFLGKGDGTFQPGTVFAVGENTYAAEAVDLTGNGTLDLITSGTNSGALYVQMGNGNGTFGPPVAYTVMAPTAGNNVGVFGLAVVGFTSTISGSPPPPGQPEVTGTPGVYATAQSRSGNGPGVVEFLPAQFDSHGQFTGFGSPQLQATLDTAGKITAFDEDGRTELAATEIGGVRVIYGVPQPQTGAANSSALTVPANTTLATARDLGNTVHLITQPQAIVSGFENAYYTYHVPTEDVPGSGAEVIDFSALFQDVGGAGLGMEVRDAAGNVLGSGDRFRIVAAQGSLLTIHIFGEPGAVTPSTGGLAQGTGVYTLDIVVLPQVVSVQALSPIPGGPVTSIVLTFQGDNLDPVSSQDPANYTVQFLSGFGGAVPIAASFGGQPITYNPGVNVDVTSGLTYPTAVNQTVTLDFSQPLAPGSYEIALSPAIQAAPYNAAEASILVPGDGSFAGHPVVTVAGGGVVNGARLNEPGLVTSSVTSTAPGAGVAPSRFLTQLQGDLGAVLNQGLRAASNDAVITGAVNDQIIARYAPMYASPVLVTAAHTPPSFVIIWFDPVSIDLQSPQGLNLSYNLSNNALSNGLGSSFVSVGGNVETIVLENAAGTFNLDVANVPATARGGAVMLSASGFSTDEFTAELQGGVTAFQLDLAGNAGTAEGSGSDGASAPGGGGTTVVANGPGGGGSGSAPGTTGGSVPGSGLLTLASAVLTTGLIAGPVTNGTGTSASSATGGPGAAAAAAAPATAATAVTQPLPTTGVPRLSAESAEEQPGQEEPSGGLPPLQAILQAVKQMVFQASGVMGALGRKVPGAVLRQFQGMLEKLNVPAAANPSRGNDALKAAKPAPGPSGPSAALGPAPMPAQGASLIDTVPWDYGIDGLVQESARRGPARFQPHAREAWVFSLAAFLSSSLVRSELGERQPARSPAGRRPRLEPRE